MFLVFAIRPIKVNAIENNIRKIPISGPQSIQLGLEIAPTKPSGLLMSTTLR